MKNVVKVAIFLSLLITLLCGLNRLLVQKSPEFLMMDEFLSLDKNTVDLLCVGSSHAYTSFNTEVYWNEYGIPAFCISGPSQPVANSYYYVKEALKTQTPKVILLEASCIMFPYSNYEYGNVNNISWMPYSLNRLNALSETVAEAYQNDLEWNLCYFHNRWKDLGRQDYEFITGNYWPSTKGFNPWWNYKDYTDSITQWGTEYEVEPDAESVKYVKKIMSVCEDKNIKLVVYLSAHSMMEYDYGIINWYRKYFDTNNIDFIDGIQLAETLGIVPEIDNSNGHIAYGGSVKLSRYIGKYLSDKQYVIDKRGNNAYAAWEEWSHYFENMEELYDMANIEDMQLYLDKLARLRDTITILVYHGALEDGHINSTVLEGIRDNNLNIDFSNEDMYIAVMLNGEIVLELQSEIINDEYVVGKRKISINSDKEEGLFNIMIDYHRITELNQIPERNNLQIYLYNNIVGEVKESRNIKLVSAD